MLLTAATEINNKGLSLSHFLPLLFNFFKKKNLSHLSTQFARLENFHRDHSLCNTGMRRVTTFQSMTDRIFNGGLIIL